MSKLSQFLAKGKVCKVGGIELEIQPLTIKELDLVVKLSNPTTQGNALQEIIKITLKRSVPDATDDEIDHMGLEHFNELVAAVLEVNNLGEKKNKI